jgi:hypothetical protein
MSVNYASVWSTTYDHNWLHLIRVELARIINHNCNCSFIVLATVIMMINYDHKTFIVQATLLNYCRKIFYCYMSQAGAELAREIKITCGQVDWWAAVAWLLEHLTHCSTSEAP